MVDLPKDRREAKPPAMTDVARAAGVSAQTVSRVLRDHPYVSEDKRRRVLDAVDRLGYRMNTAAQALSSGRTRTIGVLSMATESYAGAMTQSSIERAAEIAGVSRSMLGQIERGEANPSVAIIGKLAAERALQKGISEVVFDRGGYLYHGRVQALADAAREAGLKF